MTGDEMPPPPEPSVGQPAAPGVRWPGWLSGATRLAPALIVTFSAAMALYYQALAVAPRHHHSYETFDRLHGVADPALVRAWSPRIFSLAGAEWLENHASALPKFRATGKAPPAKAVAIGQWLFVWFALVGLVLVAAHRERAVFQILGTFACVMFGYSVSTAKLRIYPWDMPALAVFTVVVALLHHRLSPKWIVLAIWAGMPFKETAVVLSLFPLALPLSRRRQFALAAVTLAGCLAIKLAVDWASGSDTPGATMVWKSFYDEGSLLSWNLRQLLTGYPLLVNAGTLLAFLVLPTSRRELLGLKVVAAAFIAGNFLFGVVNEFRIWFEMIPLSLYGLRFGYLADLGSER